MWHHGFFPFGPIFFVLLIGLVIARGFMCRRRGWRYHDRMSGRFEAEAVLQKRLASGEIGEEEYKRLKEILSK